MENQQVTSQAATTTVVNVTVAHGDTNRGEVKVPRPMFRVDGMKEKMANYDKQSNKQTTVYLTPDNYRRFRQLTKKGQKSDLVNGLLAMYFEESH